MSFSLKVLKVTRNFVAFFLYNLLKAFSAALGSIEGNLGIEWDFRHFPDIS